MSNVTKVRTIFSCKCFATKHPFLTSCSSCGFILCEKEKDSLSQCGFCGSALKLPMTAEQAALANLDASTVKAYAQKDKLLLFDREHAKRTHVHDAQADYYDSSAWLTPEEKQLIDDKLRKRKEARERRPATKRITFDLAGRKITEYIGDEDVEKEDTVDIAPSAVLIDSITYQNTDLENRRSKAGDVYRQMKQMWESG
mmetsp:Transcript_13647/g.18668  ORF Transcript_13647/g.18668 Transcript_13647/m.18668 type:complete len:199 (+) Transcript_13647:35-631(+)